MAGHPCMRPNFWQPTRIWRLWDREPMATLHPNNACIFLRAALSSGSMVMGHERENTGDAGTSVTLPVSGTSNYTTAAEAVIDRFPRSSSVGPCRNLEFGHICLLPKDYLSLAGQAIASFDLIEQSLMSLDAFQAAIRQSRPQRLSGRVRSAPYRIQTSTVSLT